VVILFYDNYIFSTYKYNPNKPKVEIPDGAVKVYSVIDGDTFRYRKEDGSLQSVRLLGVDAPESNTARYRSTECF
jgi:endonuclease YncB( thermonuclease family)